MLKNIGSNAYGEVFLSHKKTAKQLKLEPVGKRKERLISIRKWIFSHRKEIQEAIYLDLQKPPEEADLSEIYPVLTELKHAIGNITSWSSPQTVAGNSGYLGTSAKIYHEPKGVCLIISPWNYPFNLAMGPIVSAIAAGNTIILKPSEFTPNTNGIIKRLLHDLFKEEMIKMVEGEADVATELLKLPFDHIFFTGSPAVGKLVMEAAAKNLSSVTLELGGKSPTVVDETADMKDAATKIAWGKWLNAGQTCVAPDYLFVHQSRKEDLLSELKKEADFLYGKDENYSSIINRRHFERLKASLEEAKKNDSTLEFGRNPDDKNLKIYPTVISNLKGDNSLMQEEIFGPILPVLSYEKLDEVIEFINTRPKPLALYYFTKNGRNKKRIINETSSGSVVINDTVLQFAHPNLPFGGVNNSGIGKAHGKAGFIAFSNEKSVLKQRVGFTMAKSVYPPYSTLKKKMIHLMLKYF